jgi:hypothetical protein
LRLVPCSVKRARLFVRQSHRHLPEVQGGLFAVAVMGADLVGVAIAGNPPPEWQGTGRIVISRVCTVVSENACSMLYGALCRAAKALGYCEAWTYTRLDEPGTSLRAAGFQDMGLTNGGEWTCVSRPRKSAIDAGPKRRWRRVLASA